MRLPIAGSNKFVVGCVLDKIRDTRGLAVFQMGMENQSNNHVLVERTCHSSSAPPADPRREFVEIREQTKLLLMDGFAVFVFSVEGRENEKPRSRHDGKSLIFTDCGLTLEPTETERLEVRKRKYSFFLQ